MANQNTEPNLEFYVFMGEPRAGMAHCVHLIYNKLKLRFRTIGTVNA